MVHGFKVLTKTQELIWVVKEWDKSNACDILQLSSDEIKQGPYARHPTHVHKVEMNKCNYEAIHQSENKLLHNKQNNWNDKSWSLKSNTN